MKDYIDIQERPSWGRMLPLSFQHLFAMFGSTVLVPVFVESRSSNGIIYEWYWYIAVFICM